MLMEAFAFDYLIVRAISAFLRSLMLITGCPVGEGLPVAFRLIIITLEEAQRWL